jgi:hypothetical protein
MNATITVNIDDDNHSEYDVRFHGVNGFSTFEDMVRNLRRLIREEEKLDGRKVSSMVITLSF